MAVPGAPTPSSDAPYLRRLIERQPACLIRVRLDGVLLACNDAALNLFGVGALRAVLNTNLTDRIIPAERTKWQEFTTRCWANDAASLECDLVILDDKARPVLVQGVALKDHPDGVESLLLHLRDQSQTHRLEDSIHSAEIDRLDNEERQRAARDQVERATTERLTLAVLAEENQAERRRLTDALEAQTADLQRRQATFAELERRVEESQLVLLQTEREHRDRVAALNTALAAAQAAQVTTFTGHDNQELEAVTLQLQAATADQARLGALVTEYEVDRTRIAAAHHAAVDTLEQSLARAGNEAALDGAQSRQAMGELQSQLVQILAEQSRMAARAEAQERERDLVRAEHNRALADLETGMRVVAELRSQLSQASAEQSHLAALVEEHELSRNHLIAEHHRALDDVETSRREALAVAAESRSRLEQSSAEQSSLTARIQEHERERDRVIAEHHRTVADMETGKRDALAELRSQLSQAFADQRRLASRVEEHERQLDRAVADHQGALAEMETGKRDALAELRSQLSQAFANERRLAARVDEQDLERDRMRAEHYRVLADLETRKRDALTGLRAQVSQTAAEHSGILAALAETHETERARMNNDHYRAIADLQASKGEALAELRSQLSQSAAEHGRLTALLEEYDRERERIGAEHRRAIADLQVSKREAMAECERVLTEVQQALLVRDGSRLEIERRLVDAIDEGPPKKADGEIIASLQGGLTLAVSEMQAVFKDEEALERPTGETIDKATAVSETQTVLTDVDPLPELFDGADDAFVRHLLEGMREPPLPEDPADARVGSAQAVSERLTVTAGDQPAHDMFDAQDDAFAVHLMEGSPVQAREPTDETNAQPPHELPEKEPPAPEDS